MGRIKVQLAVHAGLFIMDDDMKSPGPEFHLLRFVQNRCPKLQLGPVAIVAAHSSQITIADADVAKQPACIIFPRVLDILLFHSFSFL